ncbi:CO040 protein, partial [Nycticryphes semicollaris]|nr:CO040 protein [Nycticryphes semicollaris]
AMLALAGLRRPLAAPVRGGGGAMPRKVRGAGRPRGGRGCPFLTLTAPLPLFQGKAAGKGPAGPDAAAGPVAAGEGCVRVAVRAKPGARCSAVTDVTAEAVGVAIAAPPTEGEANAELCRYLSKVLEVKKSEVILEKGGKSREKVVKILVSMTPDEILEKLKKEASS